MTWIETLLKQTEEVESPERFVFWTGLACIAAALRKNVWLDQQIYKLYPNIYVFNTGPSGVRKGVPAAIAARLLTKSNCTRVISGRNSIQAVLRDLGRAYTIEGGGVIHEAQGILLTGELSSFLVEDTAVFKILIDLYDSCYHEGEFKYSLKSATDTLKEPCFSMLASTNEPLFAEAVPQFAHTGGFLARTFVVNETKRRCINDLMDPLLVQLDIDGLASYLVDVNKLRGRVKLNNAAKKLYKDWYKTLSTKKIEDKTGTTERIHDQALKVAMLLAVSDNLSMVIKEDHMQKALDVARACLHDVRRLVLGQGTTPIAKQTAVVLGMILKREDYQMTRQKLLQRGWGEFDAYELDRIVETLVQADAITISKVGRDTVYKMTQSAVDEFVRCKEEVVDA